MPRGSVKVTLGLIEDSAPFTDVVAMFSQALDRIHHEKIENAQIDIDKQDGYYGSVTVTVSIIGYRDETDEEMAIRLQEAQRETRRKRESERATYERLRKKFEKET